MWTSTSKVIQSNEVQRKKIQLDLDFPKSITTSRNNLLAGPDLTQGHPPTHLVTGRRIQPNRCVFEGIQPNLNGLMSTIRSEIHLWGSTGARGISFRLNTHKYKESSTPMSKNVAVYNGTPFKKVTLDVNM
jgi:hypothetical protein